VVKLSSTLDQIFTPRRIDKYSDYKLLLNGDVIDKDTYLKEGDGIVLWDPLISYYENRRVKKTHFKRPNSKKNSEVFKSAEPSKIMLFVEKDLKQFNPTHVDFYQKVVRALIYKINLNRQAKGIDNKFWKQSRNKYESEILNVYQDGHKGIFKKLFS
tara:strand:- start:1191 stop:1661 length:471 start_codon:yes stop_codon:yes gene_type:complete